MRCYELDDGLTDPSERDQDGRSRGASVALERDPILRAGLLLNHPLSQQKKKKGKLTGVSYRIRAHGVMFGHVTP